MTVDTALKLGVVSALVWLVAAAVRVGRILKSRKGGRVNQMEHELPVLKVVRPVLGIVFYLALFDWLAPGTRASWAELSLPPAARWAGVVLCWASVALIRRGFAALGRHYRGGVGLWPDHELVTGGPYARVRHPIYAGFVALMAGLGLSSVSWLVGLSGLALTCAIPAVRVRVEEAQLEERFGSRYAGYAERTARFVPGLW